MPAGEFKHFRFVEIGILKDGFVGIDARDKFGDAFEVHVRHMPATSAVIEHCLCAINCWKKELAKELIVPGGFVG